MKEFEIRPQKLFNEFLEVSRKDIGRFFSDHSTFQDVPCPACGSTRKDFAFEKHGFSYQQCCICGSVYVSPRPSPDTMAAFYRDSDSSRFWAERFYPETAEARRELIFKPRADLIRKLVLQYDIPSSSCIADAGAGYGLFLEEVKKLNLFDDLIAIEPSIGLSECCRKKGLKVVPKAAEDLKEGEVKASFVCSFEVIEHLYNVQEFILGMKRALSPRGFMVFTTLTISGFDIQTLWEASKNISPPYHVNFLSIEGFHVLLQRCGLEEVEISTPGELDLDIIKNSLQEFPDLKLPRFARYLIMHRSEATQKEFQEFLRQNQMSSHVRVIAKKPLENL